LVETIDAFTSEWNERAAPFVWVNTADETLARAARKTKDHSDAQHESPPLIRAGGLECVAVEEDDGTSPPPAWST
jgi:hypothetical protein